MMIGHKDDYFEMSHLQTTNFARDAGRVLEQLGQILAIVDLLHLEDVSVEDGKDARPTQRSRFPEHPGKNDTAQIDKDIWAGWGCFLYFAPYAASMSACLMLLEKTDPPWLLCLSAFGGLLTSLGLFQTIRGIWRRSVSAMIIGVALLAGAFLLLYFHVSPDTLELIRFWVQE